MQRPLFVPDSHEASGLSPVPTPASRRSDPESSRVAAEAVKGRAASDREAILEVLRNHSGGLTAGEIAGLLGEGWDNVRVSRRTSELRDSGDVANGSIRDCHFKGSKMVTWYARQKT